MEKYYNIGLIPKNISKEVVTYARLLEAIADTYLLGNHSYPHVTLYQFVVEEKLIKPILAKLKSINFSSIRLSFDAVSCVTHDNEIYWISMMPDQLKLLHAMHHEVAAILDKPIKSNFDPHMTLINTRDKNYKTYLNSFVATFTPIADEFQIMLSEADKVGQVTSITHRL